MHRSSSMASRVALCGIAVLATAGSPTPVSAAAPDAHSAAVVGGQAPKHADPNPLPPPGPEQVITSVTTLVVFLVLLAVLGKFAWGPILGGLRARESKIRQDIADAEAARARADATLKEYNARLATAEGQVRELLAKAGADAERMATGIRMQAQQDAEEAKERAVRDIEQARKDAVREVHEQTAVLATNVAEKILRRNLNPDDQRDLVQRSLDGLEAVKN